VDKYAIKRYMVYVVNIFLLTVRKGDVPCPSYPERGSYGWDCITELGEKSPDDSVRNAGEFCL
jgi:hypothetical protein